MSRTPGISRMKQRVYDIAPLTKHHIVLSKNIYLSYLWRNVQKTNLMVDQYNDKYEAQSLHSSIPDIR